MDGIVGTLTWDACYRDCVHYDSEQGCKIPGEAFTTNDGDSVVCDEYEKTEKED